MPSCLMRLPFVPFLSLSLSEGGWRESLTLYTGHLRNNRNTRLVIATRMSSLTIYSHLSLSQVSVSPRIAPRLEGSVMARPRRAPAHT